jgi:membrane-bound lytic murein transglycosylase B
MPAASSPPARGRRTHTFVVAAVVTLLTVMASDRAPIPAALVRSQSGTQARAGSSTATPPADTTPAGADGSDLAARVTNDPALRKTLLALRQDLLGSRPQAGSSAVAGESAVVGGSVADIPAAALAAYRRAAGQASVSNPGCHLPWNLLAGIGRVESDHGLNGGSRPDVHGVIHPAILGPVLDGANDTAAIPDTDQGRYDGDTRWDRAVGPMQFIPSTWATSGRDGDGDGVADPENLFDAALAAGDYLCRSGGDMRTLAAARQAVLSYNHSSDYVLIVLGYSSAYAGQDVSALTAYLRSNPVPKIPRLPARRASRAPAKHPKTVAPSGHPSASPSITPSTSPRPTAGPPVSPKPSHSPSPSPTSSATQTPDPSPTPLPSLTPSACPTPTPTGSPSPSTTPTDLPSDLPTAVPSTGPSPSPSPTCG